MERKEELGKILRVVIGIVVFSIGNYISMLGRIGLVPWDSLAMGISDLTPLTYGQVNIAISLLIVAADVLLKEKIGLGTLIDAVLIGVIIDLCMFFLPLKGADNTILGMVYMITGMLIMAYGQSVYMAAGLSCGPRDALCVGIGKRFPKVSIGVIDIVMKVGIVAVSMLIGGPVGIGTLLGMFGMGTAMHIVYGWRKFDPRLVENEDVVTSMRKLFSPSDEQKPL